MRPCTRELSHRNHSLERTHTHYGTNTRKTNFPTQSLLNGVVVFFTSAVITRVQMGEISKLGWLDGLAETCRMIPCISCMWYWAQSARLSLRYNILLSRFDLKTEKKFSLQNVVFWKINRIVFLDKDRTMDTVQEHNICTNVPSNMEVKFVSFLTNQFHPYPLDRLSTYTRTIW
jgi:hypothetical protein